MGIEPTCRAVHARHSDFEDRGHHQVCRHFHSERRSWMIALEGANDQQANKLS